MVRQSNYTITMVAGLIGTALGFFLPSVVEANDPPNIVFILTDDQGLDAIDGPTWTNELNCRTPQLAQLASQGRVFSNMRVNSMCSPSRAALLTGRQCIHTGVVGLIGDDQPTPDRDLLSLQSYETTMAEMLQSTGYYTILSDKWHLGWSEAEGQLPEQQGFDEFIDGRDLWSLDDPEVVGDEHITRIVNITAGAVNTRPRPSDPYALFLWTKDPHKRSSDSKDFKWWKMDPALQPSGENYYAEPETEVNRFRGHIEAMDTEIGRFLRDIGVTDDNGEYVPASNTLVIFMSDGGTDRKVSTYGDKAKLSLFEGGIHVPMFAFGEGVPDDGKIIDRLLSHVDLFDTFADVAEANDEARGPGPRSSMSFADDLGDFPATPRREYSLSSRPATKPVGHAVALVSERYKLLVRGGGANVEKLTRDRFFDLARDPLEEANLLESRMSKEEVRQYGLMRDAIVDYWPIAVGKNFRSASLTPSIPFKTKDLPVIMAATRTSTDLFLTDPKQNVGFFRASVQEAVEARAYYQFDIQKMPQVEPEDVLSAQIVIAFDKDEITIDDTDTGPIRVYSMQKNPFDPRLSWDDLVSAYDSVEIGSVDLAPHILVNTPRFSQLRGVPMPFGTPVSFGRNIDLIGALQHWLQNPEEDFGVVLIADDLIDLIGDQHVSLSGIAVLRVTLKQ